MARKLIGALCAAVLLLTFVLPVHGLAAADYSTIRVHLVSMGSPTSVTFVVKGAYRIAEAAGVDLFPGITYTMSVSGDGLALEYNNGLGPVSAALPATATFVQYANGSGANCLYVSNPTYGWRHYAGSMTFTRPSGAGYIRLINALFFETYLYGVVAYEMSNSWPVEALKAQAVCARTYSMRYMKANASKDYHIGDTSANQVYKGMPLNADGTPQQRVVDAVNGTRGQVICIGDPASLNPADGVFSASNGGQVRTAGMHWGSANTYHVFKDDPYDLGNPSSPEFVYVVPRSAAALNALTGKNREKAELFYGLLKARVIESLQAQSVPCSAESIAVTGVLSAAPSALRDGMPAGSRLFTKVEVRLTYINTSATQPPEPTATPAPTDTPNATASPAPTDVDAPESPEPEQTEQAGGGGAPLAGDYYGEMTVTLDYISKSSTGWDVYGELKTAFKGYSSLICTKNMWNLYESSDAECFYIVARGYGHGVGLSQRGAQQMANGGCGYGDILEFYYNLSATSAELGTVSLSEPALSPIPGSAAPLYGTVAADLNVRAAANAGATAVYLLPRGAQVEVLGTEGDWYRVLYAPAGIVGYACYRSGSDVYIGLTNALEPTPAPIVGKARVSKYLSLRKTASTGAKTLAKIPKNGEMTVLQVYPSSKWLKVAYAGKTGYVLSGYVTVGGNKAYDVATATKAVNVRKGAGTGYGLLGTLKKGDNIIVVGSKTVKKVRWYKVQYRGTVGWLDSRYVRKGA